MARDVTALVVGSRGLLGHAVVEELGRRGAAVHTASVTWHDEALAGDQLAAALGDLVALSSQRAWWVLWCAGAGVTSTPQDVLDLETRTLGAFVERLAALPPDVRARGTFFFASSAGGLYAGASNPPFTELTTPRPIAPYGHAKLEAETLVSGLAAADVAVAIGRLSNLFGPGQNVDKPQGLVSQLCRAHRTARPAGIYVSLDTLRDYLFVRDAAELVVDLTAAAAERRGRVVTKILANGLAVSVGALLGEMRRVLKRRVPVVLAASPFARQQARDLRLRSVVLPELDRRPRTTLATGIAATDQDIGRRLAAVSAPGRAATAGTPRSRT